MSSSLRLLSRISVRTTRPLWFFVHDRIIFVLYRHYNNIILLRIFVFFFFIITIIIISSGPCNNNSSNRRRGIFSRGARGGGGSGTRADVGHDFHGRPTCRSVADIENRVWAKRATDRYVGRYLLLSSSSFPFRFVAPENKTNNNNYYTKYNNTTQATRVRLTSADHRIPTVLSAMPDDVSERLLFYLLHRPVIIIITLRRVDIMIFWPRSSKKKNK